jgi:Flp pilus assembly protein TadG
VTSHFTSLRRLIRDQDGTAAIETALIGSMFVVLVLNTVEIGRYGFHSMQLSNATQAGAQAAVTVCDPESQTPVTTNCTALTGAVTAAVRASSLGTSVSLYGAPTEGWYCVTAARTLMSVGSVNNKPANCGAAGDVNAQPALYLQVNTRYTYAPMFPGMTLAATFPTSLTRTAWMRVK